MRGSFSKSKIHPCLTVVAFWQLFHLRDFILMGITVFVPLRSALNAGPLDLQRPHALVFDITDVFWLPLKKWSQQHRCKWKGQPFLLMLASLCDESFQRKGGICREQIEGKMLRISDLFSLRKEVLRMAGELHGHNQTH